MTEPRWQDVERVLLNALELEGEALEAYLQEACAGDSELRAEVERLLQSHRMCEGNFLRIDEPSPGVESSGVVDEPLLAKDSRLGKYRILRRIGEGGMATVYLAEHCELKNRVALKILPRLATTSPERVERFKREAVMVAKLRHPAIVSVHDVGEDQGLHFLVMDHIEGPTYAQFLRDARSRQSAEGEKFVRGREYIQQQSEWIARIAEALEHAHQHGIVHRDVKPSNVLLRDGVEPLLADFGVAKNLLEPSHTATGQLAGTAPYMSPEQARAVSSAIDPRSDVFSLGVMLYEALTLIQPFRGETLEETLNNVLYRNPPRLDQVNPGVRRDLVTICRKALEKDRQHRYSTAAHMAGDLRSFLAGRPILASPPSLRRRSFEFLRAHRMGVLIGAVLVLLLVVGGFWTYTARLLRAEQGLVTLEVVPGGSRAFLQRYERARDRFGERVFLGKAPAESHVDAAHYRVTVVGEGGREREASLVVERGGEANLVLDLSAPLRGQQDMVFVEGGECGDGLRVESFYLDRREVSNAEYREFVTATGRRQPVIWQKLGYPSGHARHPVVGVSWLDAQAYAQWAGKRLPTSREWTYAAQYPDRRKMPWGKGEGSVGPRLTNEEITDVTSATPEASFAQYLKHTRPTDEDPYPSYLGLMHTAGNVMEYTETADVSRQAVTVKGIAWMSDPRKLDLDSQVLSPIRRRGLGGDVEEVWSVRIGFRCATSASVRESREP